MLDRRYPCAVLLAATILCGCRAAITESRHVVSLAGSTMGTRYSIRFVATGGPTDYRTLHAQVEAELQTINQQMSTYIASSELSQFNSAEPNRWQTVSEGVISVIERSLQLGEQTAGALDVTIGPLVTLWNFGPGRDARPMTAPSASDVLAARQRTGSQHLGLRHDPPALKKSVAGLEIDLSAVAKGYAVDVLAALFDGRDIGDYMIEIGGEVRCRGRRADQRPWQIGIERPDKAGRVVQRVIPVDNMSLATSGDYRNYYEVDGQRYSHLLDPATGRPVAHQLASVTVVDQACLTADGLATALLVMGPDKGYLWADEHDVAALFLTREGTQISERLTPRMQDLLKSQ